MRDATAETEGNLRSKQAAVEALEAAIAKDKRDTEAKKDELRI